MVCNSYESRGWSAGAYCHDIMLVQLVGDDMQLDGVLDIAHDQVFSILPLELICIIHLAVFTDYYQSYDNSVWHYGSITTWWLDSSIGW